MLGGKDFSCCFFRQFYSAETVANDLTNRPRASPTVMNPTTINAVAPISALIDWSITLATITNTIVPTTRAIPALIKSAIPSPRVFFFSLK